MLNRAVIIGRLTKDPDYRQTNNGTALTRFSLAVDRKFKGANGERATDFLDIVTFGKTAENCANFLSKGKLAAVDGSVQVNSYVAKDGSKRTVYQIVAEDVRFLSPKDKPMTEDAPDPMFGNSDEDLPF
jgi:single-strand DNA-binding protein